MKIDPLKDGDACQTHDECSEEREARAVHTINSVRAGICEERGEEGHMLGAGRCEWHVRAAREVRDAGRCRTVQSERASTKRASESARMWRARGGVQVFDPTYLWKKGDRREASGADVPAP